MKQIFTFLSLFVVALTGLSQVIHDGETNVLTGKTNSFTGDVTIGTNSPFTLLVLSDNSMLTNTANGIIGRNTAARSNEVQLLSGSSRWFIGGNLFVGNDGAFNRLIVRNGANVRSGNGYLGPNGGSSNNLGMVTGSGSTWSNANVFYLGFNGPGNLLVVSNGGALRANVSDIAVNSSSSNNLAIVTGPGSLWSNAFEIQFGIGGAGNQLVISNGGTLRSASGFLGSGVPSSNNLALISGTGSLWTNATDLFVGHSGSGNRLIVSDGGVVRNGHAYVGGNTPGSNNLALVTGPGSAWSNNLDLEVGAFSANNAFIASNGASVSVGGSVVVGPTLNGNANALLVTDSGTALVISNDIYAGSNGALSRLTITNGAMLENKTGIIGFGSFSSNNIALVYGVGSVWSNRGELHIGQSGRGNQLRVSAGAFVFAAAERIIGNSAGADSNVVVVTDGGSRWFGASNLQVGRAGSFNQLIVSNGASVTTLNEIAQVGDLAGANSNLVSITGAGSLCTNQFDLRIGDGGAGNSVVVSNGGFLVNSNAYFAYSATSSNNVALISGAGTIWSNRQVVFLGQAGPGNRLILTNGARLESRFGTIGVTAGSSNNEMIITGPGTFWRMEQGFYVGDRGGGNRLVITNGGLLYGSGTIGNNSANNEVIVTGAGSAWTNGSDLNVGAVGSGNRLVISDGGLVHEQPFGIIVGTGSGSTNNRLVVNGGTLRATNTISGMLDVRRGTNVLNAGLIDIDQLRITNILGRFEFNGGTLSTRGSQVSNGTLFRVGDGTSLATFFLKGNGTHDFTGTLAVMLSSNAVLSGNGVLLGGLVVSKGATLSPGNPVGRIVLSNSPSLQGLVVMEISRNGSALTNDQLQVPGTLTLGGSLVVSNLGPGLLAAGDRFQLFSAAAFTGSFSTIALPPLGAGLDWKNTVSLDGAIEVVALTQPAFTGIGISGTNAVVSGSNGVPNAAYVVLSSTNVAQPLSNWDRIATNHFGGAGEFSFTNAILSGESQRYFLLQLP